VNETLILQLGATPAHPVRWAFCTDGAIVRSDVASNVDALSGLAARARGVRLVAAVLPGEDVAMRALAAPPKSAAQLRAAARLLLEDELAENLDQVHVATARHDSGAGIALAIKKSLLETWLSALADAGLSPDLVTPDFALTPMMDGRAVVIETGERVVGVVGLKGFAVDKPLADALLPEILSDEQIRKVVLCASPATAQGLRADLEIDHHGRLGPDALTGFFIEGLAKAPNLLQGEYRKKRDWRAEAGPWRRTGMLAAACAAALVVGIAADSIRSTRLADRLQEETLALHRAAFPDASNTDPRTYARQVLGASGGGVSFLALTNSVAESLQENTAVELDRIRFSAVRSEYSINVRFGDIAQLEQLKRSLEGRGLRAEENGGVRRAGGVFLGELKVSRS